LIQWQDSYSPACKTNTSKLVLLVPERKCIYFSSYSSVLAAQI